MLFASDGKFGIGGAIYGQGYDLYQSVLFCCAVVLCRLAVGVLRASFVWLRSVGWIAMIVLEVVASASLENDDCEGVCVCLL